MGQVKGICMYIVTVTLNQVCGVKVGVGGNFRWSWSRKEFLGGVRVGKNVPTLTPT
jgi:hypothetical protein